MANVDDEGFIFVPFKKGRKRKNHNRNHDNNINVEKICLHGREQFTVSEIVNKISRVREDLQQSDYWVELKGTLLEFMSTLPGAEDKAVHKKPDLTVVCYGIGKFGEDRTSRHQMALLLLMIQFFQQQLGDVLCFLYDPVLVEGEKQALSDWNITDIGHNEVAKRVVNGNTLFYMPHLLSSLYNNLLSANWSLTHLTKVAIIGNSFTHIDGDSCRVPENTPEEEIWYIKKVLPYMVEQPIRNIFCVPNIFNHTALMTFPLSKVCLMPVELWADKSEPDCCHLENISQQMCSLSCS